MALKEDATLFGASKAAQKVSTKIGGSGSGVSTKIGG
jgi:hypothetical protein